MGKYIEYKNYNFGKIFNIYNQDLIYEIELINILKLKLFQYPNFYLHL